MITQIAAKNFQGLAEASIELADITVLYGENGAGKSSVADALFHVFTGGVPRGELVADVVRQGAKSCEVGVLLADGPSFVRRRARSGGGKQLVGGKDVSAGEYDAAVIEALGASIPSIAASLKAGHILSLKPSELQQLLLALTGSSVDADAIAEALGAEVTEAAARIRVPLPASLDDFAGVAKAAVEARKVAKRLIDAAKEDLARLPQPADELADAASKTTISKARAGVAELRKLRDAALKAAAVDVGAREERVRQLRARVEELQAIPEAKGGGDLVAAEKELAAADGDLARRRADVAMAEKQIRPAVKVEDGDEQLASRAASLRGELAGAEKDLRQAEQDLADRRAEFARLQAELDAIPEKAQCDRPCQHCSHGQAAVRAVQLERELDEKKKLGQVAKGLVGGTTDRVESLRKELAAAESAADRVRQSREHAEAAAALDRAKEKLAASEKARDAAARKVDQLRPGAESAHRYVEAQRELATVSRELQRLESEPVPEGEPVDVAALDTRIARGEAVIEAIGQIERRADAEGRVTAAAGQVADADMVARVCGPDGVRSQIVAGLAGPVIDAANDALQVLAAGRLSVEVSSEELAFRVRRGDGGEGPLLAPDQLSDGERSCVLWALQYAAAQLSGVRLLVLDRTELVSDRNAVKRFAGWAVGEGCQVLMLTCAPAPAAVPAGLAAWVMEGGEAVAVGRAE